MTTPTNNWNRFVAITDPVALPVVKQTDFYYSNEIMWVSNNNTTTTYLHVDAIDGIVQYETSIGGVCASLIGGYSNTLAILARTNPQTDFNGIDILYAESIEPSIGVSPFSSNFLQTFGSFTVNSINYSSVGAYNIAGIYTSKISFNGDNSTAPTTAIGVYAANYSPTSGFNSLTYNNSQCIINFDSISNVFCYSEGAYSYIAGKGTPSTTTLQVVGSNSPSTVTTTQQNSFFLFSFDSNLANSVQLFDTDYSGKAIVSFIPRNMVANGAELYFIYDSETSSGNAGLFSMNAGSLQPIFSITTTGTASTTNYITAGDIDLFGNEVVAVFNFRGVVQYNSQIYVSANNGSNISCLMVFASATDMTYNPRFYQFGESTSGNIYTSAVKNGAPGSVILSGSASLGTYDMFGENLTTTGTNNAWLASFDLQ